MSPKAYSLARGSRNVRRIWCTVLLIIARVLATVDGAKCVGEILREPAKYFTQRAADRLRIEEHSGGRLLRELINKVVESHLVESLEIEEVNVHRMVLVLDVISNDGVSAQHAHLIVEGLRRFHLRLLASKGRGARSSEDVLHTYLEVADGHLVDVEADWQLCKERPELSEVAKAELIFTCSLIELLCGDASLCLWLHIQFRCMHPVDPHVDLAAVPFRPHVVRA
mmetsp:Transcript_18813/g.38232  ORF Transcript_18813/g.38232 Transcript_18813/m.38232 type:complete len:225 (-) Transcript_18813:831-1505(-)